MIDLLQIAILFLSHQVEDMGLTSTKPLRDFPTV